MVVHTVQSLAETGGELWRKLQADCDNEHFNIASPLSSTPLPIYKWVISHAGDFSNWQLVRFILMDEQVENLDAPYRYIETNDPASYERFALKHLLDPLGTGVGITPNILKP